MTEVQQHLQERHWKRAAARAIAHDIAAASRSSMLRHTAVIDEELQSCQQKVCTKPSVSPDLALPKYHLHFI